jgi:hypothetical protein
MQYSKKPTTSTTTTSPRREVTVDATLVHTMAPAINEDELNISTTEFTMALSVYLLAATYVATIRRLRPAAYLALHNIW